MTETCKLAAILVSDVVGYSRLAGADEDRILARLRTLRSDLIDPTIAVHHGRIVKRTGDGAIIELRSERSRSRPLDKLSIAQTIAIRLDRLRIGGGITAGRGCEQNGSGRDRFSACFSALA